jgi:hypothetical protein
MQAVITQAVCYRAGCSTETEPPAVAAYRSQASCNHCRLATKGGGKNAGERSARLKPDEPHGSLCIESLSASII